jgi:hypothetical protein
MRREIPLLTVDPDELLNFAPFERFPASTGAAISVIRRSVARLAESFMETVLFAGFERVGGTALRH